MRNLKRLMLFAALVSVFTSLATARARASDERAEYQMVIDGEPVGEPINFCEYLLMVEHFKNPKVEVTGE